MRVFHQEFRHPTQAGRVRLSVFEQEGGGFLVTEERDGSATVVATLGLFDQREAALQRAQARAAELQRQRYRPLDTAPDAAPGMRQAFQPGARLS